MQSNSVISHSPSFSSYTSSDRLAKIAARVVQEFQAELDFDDYLFDEKEHGKEDEVKKNNREENHETEEEEEFEFAFVCREPDLSPIPADQIFYNGQIRPVYPLFNTDLLLAHEADQVENSISSTKTSSAVRLPLGKLFIEERERDTASSCSSSEADELDGVPAGTYCVWTPKTAESPGTCNKSNSTGTSKRWKFRDLLHRSNSDGTDTFVFLAPSSKKSEGKAEKGAEEAAKISGNTVKTKVVGGGNDGNVRIGTRKESDRRQSYLPYKKDLVGVFANVNGVSRSLRPF